MGCLHTKVKINQSSWSRNGATIVPALQLGTKPPATPARFGIDNKRFRVPLTEREVMTIMKSWKAVKDNLMVSGMAMFLRMFQMRKDVRESFEQFRTMEQDVELWENRTLQTHGLVVMSAIDEVMVNLDDEEYVIELIIEQGRSHARFGDLNSRMFWAIERPFLLAVEETLGEKYTQVLATLYQKTIRYILTTLIEGFDLGVQEAFGPYGKGATQFLTTSLPQT